MTDKISERILENDVLRVTILPEKGGKLSSILYKPTQSELLFQNPKNRFEAAEWGSDFSKFEACGFDDAFPNVDKEIFVYRGIEYNYPDHGEIWTAQFESWMEEDACALSWESRRYRYRYCKKVRIENHTVKIDYRIDNQTDQPLPCIWTMHCLMKMTPEMRFYFPEGTSRVENVFDNPYLGSEGRTLDYPEDRTAGRVLCLDRPPKEGAVKYYAAGRVSEGNCGMYYPEWGLRVRISFPADILPYLGLWITAGGYRGDYNCAMEPCSAYYDSVRKAKSKMGEVPSIAAGGSMQFEIGITVEEDCHGRG